MKSFIFMNHHIREKNSKEPFITIQSGDKYVYCNQVTIMGPSVIKTGELAEVDSHMVKAWIECDSADLRIL